MLIIEDGSGVAFAESYATAAELQAYATKRGKSEVSGLDETALEALLVQAMDYLATKKYKGVAVTTLPFPRADIGFDGVIPDAVKNAQMVLAISAHTTPLMRDKTPDNVAQVASQTVGSVSVSYHDTRGKAGSATPVFTYADSLLADFIDSTKGSFGVAFIQRV